MGDLKNANRVKAWGFYFLSAVCVFVIAVGVAIARYVPKFFAIHLEYISAVITLFLLAGLASALNSPLSIFEGTFEAVGRLTVVWPPHPRPAAPRRADHLPLVEGWGLRGVGGAVIVRTLASRLLVVQLSKREIPRRVRYFISIRTC